MSGLLQFLQQNGGQFGQQGPPQPGSPQYGQLQNIIQQWQTSNGGQAGGNFMAPSSPVPQSGNYYGTSATPAAAPYAGSQ